MTPVCEKCKGTGRVIVDVLKGRTAPCPCQRLQMGFDLAQPSPASDSAIAHQQMLGDHFNLLVLLKAVERLVHDHSERQSTIVETIYENFRRQYDPGYNP